jgi:CPA1 family monovalent cation:H+ antiporter
LWAVIGLVAGVLAVTRLAGYARIPPPILLLAAGFAVSFIPGVPEFALDPHLMLSVIIPPLLYAAAVESGVVAIRRLLQPILQLAFGLVLVTAFAVAFVMHALLPSIPFPVALALGAIVAPPDAVSAIAIGRRVGLPRTVMSVLEGESLFNDAASLTILRVAVAAFGTGAIGWWSAAGQFAWAVTGGVLAGLIVGALLSVVRRLAGAPLTVTVLSLLTPFLAYLVGEEIRASGVLAVVTAGLLLGFRGPVDLPARVRLTETATWGALRFAVEGVVFALIGLQLWGIVTAVDIAAPHVLLAIVAVLATTIVVRPVWIWLGALVTRLWRPHSAERAKNLAVVSWSGMRGVISLAAAQTLPLDTPGRAVLLTCTVAVIVGTLLIQGLSLPGVVRRLAIDADPAEQEQAEREAARREASEAIAERIEEVARRTGSPPEQVQMMHRWAALRDWRSWGQDRDSGDEDSGDGVSGDGNSGNGASGDARTPEGEVPVGTAGSGDGVSGDRSSGGGSSAGRTGGGVPAVPPMAVLRRWQQEIVQIERDVLIRMRNSGRLSEDVLRSLQQDLDLEEALLQARADREPGVDTEGHLDELPEELPPHEQPGGV